VKFFSFFLMVFLHLHGFSARPVQGRCPSAYTPQHCIWNFTVHRAQCILRG
jgi:hypothetical protein